MPLGSLFGGGSNNGPKPQPLQSETKKEKREKVSSSAAKDIDTKDCKGVTIKINKKTFTIEKKLAEGGFAIVYLVYDKHSRYYALKRQLIRDDPRQLEACKTESQIVKNLSGHKNLIAYIDHQITFSKSGVYDYMLLTVYYKTSVLQLMNSRLLANKWLTVNEILDIFCDMCEAVARLHHSKTPVIHRDLKIENVLIDQRSGSEKPVYVLCDMGSCTTKVLNRDIHSMEQIDDEIRRYTTLSYRAPEMVDLFSGVPIGTKSDIWALGVMLYKLCYFALPFGESALAIQNGSFQFPDTPPIPEEIKAIINFLLTSSAVHRPNIFQTSYLAFSAANRKCPVYNIQRSPRIELLEAVKIFRMRDRLGANYARALEKAINEAYSNTMSKASTTEPNRASTTTEEQSHPQASEAFYSNLVHSSSSNNPFLVDTYEPKVVPTPIAPISTYIEPLEPSYLKSSTTTTSVNPRLRPKPTASLYPQQPLKSPLMVPPVSPRATKESQSQGFVNPLATNGDQYDTVDTIKLQSTNAPVQPTINGQANMNKLESNMDTMKISQISTESSKSAPEHSIFGKPFVPPAMPLTPCVPLSFSTVTTSSSSQPPTNLKCSAFKPYSMTSRSQTNNAEKTALTFSTSSNPFLEQSQATSQSPAVMDDNAFGERFDELRRVNRRNTIGTDMNQPAKYNRNLQNTLNAPSRSQTAPYFRPDAKIMQLISEEPFASAPFHHRQVYESNRDHAWIG